MSDKSEVITFRLTPEMRDKLNEWMDGKGYSGEPDAIRGMIREVAYEQERLVKRRDEGIEEVVKKLDRLEAIVREENRPFWERYFQ